MSPSASALPAQPLTCTYCKFGPTGSSRFPVHLPNGHVRGRYGLSASVTRLMKPARGLLLAKSPCRCVAFGGKWQGIFGAIWPSRRREVISEPPCRGADGRRGSRVVPGLGPRRSQEGHRPLARQAAGRSWVGAGRAGRERDPRPRLVRAGKVADRLVGELGPLDQLADPRSPRFQVLEDRHAAGRTSSNPICSRRACTYSMTLWWLVGVPVTIEP